MKERRFQVAAVIIGGALLFGLILCFSSRLVGSDDTTFQVQIQPYNNVIDWVIYRYNSWSGRVFAEAFVYIFSPLNIIAWKIVSLFAFLIGSAYLYLYYTLFSSKRSRKKDIAMACLAVAMPYLMQKNVIFPGELWVTGSMNYFWISTLALIGFYPFAFLLKHKKLPGRWITSLGLICTIMATSSQEQVGAVIFGLSLLSVTYLYLAKRRLHLFHLIYPLVAGASFAVGMLAPGNRLRFVAETKTWLPDFNTVPLNEHLHYAYRWFLDATINHTGFLLAGIMIILGVLLVNRPTKTKIDIVMSGILVASSIIILTRGFETVQPFVQFYATWKAQIPQGVAPKIVAIAWLIPLATTIIAPFRLFHKKSLGLGLSTLIASAYASIAIITLSPTMYASGWRTVFVPSVILMAVLYALFNQLIDKHAIASRYVLFALLVLAACGWCALLYIARHSLGSLA